jgi:hypothetical protein
MRIMICDDLNHDLRKEHPYWQPLVGFRRDLPKGPPLTGHGHICRACSIARGLVENEKTFDEALTVFARMGISPKELAMAMDYASTNATETLVRLKSPPTSKNWFSRLMKKDK